MRYRQAALQRLAPLILPVQLLTGCGGGGNDAVIEIPPPIAEAPDDPAEPEPAPEPEPEPPLDPEPPPPPPLTKQERHLTAVNAFRTAEQLCPGEGTVYAAAPPVRWDGDLELAGIAHSDDMAAHDFLSHAGSDGSHFSTRAHRAGYRGVALFEVIAAGNSSFERTLRQWIGSRTGHCGFLMRPEVNEIGAGIAFDAGSTYGHYWTLLGGIAGPPGGRER